MNLNDFLTEVYNGFGYLQTDSNGATRATRWINQAYNELCDAEDWPFLEASTSGAAPLTVSDLSKIVDVIDTTAQRTLIQSEHAAITTNVSDLTLVGSPLYYYLTAGNVVNVFPVSTSDSLTVRYYKNPTDLALSTDTPIVPTAYHDLILLGAWRRAYLEDSAGADYQLVVAEYERRLAQMRDALLVSPAYQTLTGASIDG